VLRPGGQFLFSVWGDRKDSAFDLVAQVVGERLSRDPTSLVSPPYNDVDMVRGDLASVAFSSIAVEEITKVMHSNSARDAAMTMTHGGLIRAAIEAHAPDRLDEMTDAAATTIATRFGEGPIDAPLRALLFTAVCANE
jgi:hypothetical protein